MISAHTFFHFAHALLFTVPAPPLARRTTNQSCSKEIGLPLRGALNA